MYTKFYGLDQRPFILSADPEFFYLSGVHNLALTHLEYGLVHNVGFIALTGEVGAGKTTLLKYFFTKVRKALDIALLFNTNLDPDGFLEMLAKEFELTPFSRRKSDVIEALFRHFMDQYARGQRCVIVVDEAQNLPAETFEELRMLSNLEPGNDFLLQVILVGQPQLRERLAQPALRQLAQRISVIFHLAPLMASEVDSYIRHRLKVAGHRGNNPLFQADAVERVALVSGGIPRVINAVCDAALAYGYADGLEQVGGAVIDRVVAENPLLGELAPRRAEAAGPPGGAAEEPDTPAASNPPGPPAAAAGTRSWPAPPPTPAFLGRIEALEQRLHTLESGGVDRILEVLQTMLQREREKSAELERKYTALRYKYRELYARIEALEREPVEFEPESKTRKLWRFFRGQDH
jgi:general secretion pathway protein A